MSGKSTHPLWGKYRGVVVDSADPMNRGRLRVRVPEVTGDGVSAWAVPCVPYAGAHRSPLEVPPPGTPVWVEFEGGDASAPIWVGCFCPEP